MFKKVYVEITNNCNLNCEFCAKNSRKKKFISVDEFQIILDKLDGFTKYIYLHVLGEPLLHPRVCELIDLASKSFYVNITTNGYLIKRIENNHNIRQLNISLHSFNPNNNFSLDDYLDNIFSVVDNLCSDTFIQYRLWTKSKYSKDIIDKINNKYYTKINCDNISNNAKIADNIFISTHEEFIWPSLDNDLYLETGKCYALKDHIGILVDGSVVPCCLDSEGIITLGNIYNDNLNDIISSKRYKSMLNGFKNNKKCEDLCKHCNFIK